MQIAPDILGRHLHDAAVEQVAQNYRNEGYAVEREAQLGLGQARADLLARRGAESVVIEVKVVGDGQVSGLGRISEAARSMGAGFRLVLVNPQRVVGIKLHDARAVVLDGLRAGSGASAPPGEVVRVEGVELDAISLQPDETELSGSAVAFVRRVVAVPGANAPDIALPVRFTIAFNKDHRITRPPAATYDLEDWDDWDGPDA